MHKIYYKGKEYLASIPDIIDIQINNSSIVDSESQIASIPTLIGTDGTSNGVTGLVPQPTTADRNKFLKSDGTWAIPAGGGGGGTVDSTDIPTAGKVSEFDENAKMNSTDMTDAEIESYFENITYNPMIVNDTVPIGAIQAYGGEVAPNNWLICDGSAVSRTTYSKLFAAIGETYGVGDGETTFNLPDLRGNVAIGASEDYELGDSGGEAWHALTQTEVPNLFWHTNNIPGDSLSLAFNGGASYGMCANPSIGEGDEHNNMQPYIVTNYIIKANDDKVTGGQLQALTDFFYPVGSYYETSDITFNPNVSFGGTWELEVEGQVHVSAGTGYTVSGASSNRTDGGATTSATGNHTLTISEMPSHSHGSGASGYVNGTPYGWASLPSTGDHIAYRSWATDAAGGGAAHNHGSVSTMQPYIVVNRWHRTA